MTAGIESEVESVSVLIGARDGISPLLACLESLAPQRDPGVQIVVALQEDGESPAPVRDRFPWVELVAVTGRPNLGDLRAAALAAARGEIVAFTDPHCTVEPGWIAALREAIASGADAAGGAVRNGSRGSIADWTAFLFDYGAFLPPVEAGPCSDLSGNNVAFRREVLGESAAYAADGFWKYFIALRLAKEGRRSVMAPGMVVAWRRQIGLARLVHDRFHFGRVFAARRMDSGTGAFRLRYLLATPFLPALVTYRLFARLLARPVVRAWTARAAIPLALTAVAWGAGEAVGVLLGRGASERHVY